MRSNLFGSLMERVAERDELGEARLAKIEDGAEEAWNELLALHAGLRLASRKITTRHQGLCKAQRSRALPPSRFVQAAAARRVTGAVRQEPPDSPRALWSRVRLSG